MNGNNALTGKTNDNLWKALIGVNIFLLLLLFARTFFCINMTDEVFNIEESFCFLQGNHFLVENWGYYQTGDLFLLPFLKLYYSITGSSVGIVLYTRICFVLIQILFSLFAYKILSSRFDKISSAFAVLVYSSAVAYKIFNFWYDTWENLFRLCGILLIFYVLTDINNKRSKIHCLLIFVSGILHALMVFSYPTTIIVYIFIAGVFIFRKNGKYLLMYILGAGFVFAVFMSYVLSIGIGNVGILSKVSLSDSGRGNMFGLYRLMNLAKQFVIENAEHYRFGLLIYLIDVIVFVFVKKTGKLRFLFYSIAVLGCLIHLLENYFDMLTLHTMLTYLSFYVPFIYSLAKKEEHDKNNYRLLIVLFLISSYIAGIAYTVTALFGPVKFGMGARTGAIVALILIFDSLKNYRCKLELKNSFGIICTFLIGFNLFNLYYSSSWGEGFIGTRPLNCDYVIDEGIFKGILENRERGDMYVRMERGIRNSVKDSDRTIACGFYAIPGYLMSDLMPNTNNLWESDDYDGLRYYFDCYYGNPDIIVLNDEFDEHTNRKFLEFIVDNYTLAEDTDGFLVFHLK